MREEIIAHTDRPIRILLLSERSDDRALLEAALSTRLFSSYEIVEDGDADLCVADADGIMPATNLPLVLLCDANEASFRKVALDALRRDQLSSEIFERVAYLSAQIHTLESKLRKEGTSDPLTGLSDRTRFFDLGKQEFARSKRYDAPLSFIMVDGDHCHKINDTYGPEGGDMMLKAIAKVCLDAVREVDMVARYGGEEFAVLLPETDMIGASNVARRIHHEISLQEIQSDQGRFTVTASLGISTLSRNTEDFRTLVAEADKAMETAKRKGRNRIEPDVIFT